MRGITNTSILCIFYLLALLAFGRSNVQERSSNKSFVIDYNNNQFLKDGQPFRYISGSIHYFRVIPSDWRDRLKKMRMAGFNALQTYVEWSSHEPEPGMYDFNDILDLETFLKTAQEEDLVVILRLGPFIDAERDMGGLPYWLLHKNQDMRLRSSDPSYLTYVDEWFAVLLPKIKPLLYENGGPIIMVQVENEYGSYPACDFAYTSHMRNLVRKGLGDNVVLFTTDGGGVGYLKCGKIPGVYSTVDFGPGDITKPFEAMRLFEPQGPLVNSEYYPGWLDHWGAPHSTRDAKVVAKSFDDMLAMNASVNMYMFHGGTSFGLSSGSNLDGSFQACPTSYDYDAPLSEAGDPTEKYWIIRNITKKYLPLPSGDVPPASPKYSYGRAHLAPLGSVFQMSPLLQSVTQKWPITFEQLLMPNGLVLYETVLPFRIADPARMSISDVHDRGYVFVDSQFLGMVSREQKMYDLAVSALPNHTISIIVESQGRVCFGSEINDFKGLTTNVTINGYSLENWKMVPLPLTNMTRLSYALHYLQKKLKGNQVHPERLMGTPKGGMSFYKGSFIIPSNDSHPQDTFLYLDGWRKGLVWVNDFCLGRYWPEVGPQVALYVPRGILKKGSNTLLVLEFEASPCLIPSSCFVTFKDTPKIDGSTPK
ncbi:beta-galactosidase-like [Panulirus ornatus]|uniref:beta-galactosidase-like n=1 Tax=Panulirus ornatus TaxID=150431 RepID=UPI003A85C847